MVVLLAVLCSSACSGGLELLEQLDAPAGMTLVRARKPMVFAHTEPRYSRSGRDYLYIGPLESNRQGVREYYLWVGVATTLDRGFIAPSGSVPDTLFVTVAGEPMELPLRPLADFVRRTTEAPIYATAVPLQAELAARVTLQQLALLDTASSDSIEAAHERTLRTYVRWEKTVHFDEFLATVGGL
jgi:hypothetical protein